MWGSGLANGVSASKGAHLQNSAKRMAFRLRRRQDDQCAPRPAHTPLRHRRDRQRQLALQEPRVLRTRSWRTAHLAVGPGTGKKGAAKFKPRHYLCSRALWKDKEQ